MGVLDAYSEKYTNVSNYNYTLNNPIRYIDPDGNIIRIYYGMKNQYSSDYTYKEDRDYSKLSTYLADTYKVLDALYKAANIKILMVKMLI